MSSELLKREKPVIAALGIDEAVRILSVIAREAAQDRDIAYQVINVEDENNPVGTTRETQLEQGELELHFSWLVGPIKAHYAVTSVEDGHNRSILVVMIDDVMTQIPEFKTWMKEASELTGISMAEMRQEMESEISENFKVKYPYWNIPKFPKPSDEEKADKVVRLELYSSQDESQAPHALTSSRLLELLQAKSGFGLTHMRHVFRSIERHADNLAYTQDGKKELIIDRDIIDTAFTLVREGRESKAYLLLVNRLSEFPNIGTSSAGVVADLIIQHFKGEPPDEKLPF